MTSLLFLVMTELSPGVSILALSGVFMVQTVIDAYDAFRKKQCGDDCNIRRAASRRGYTNVGGANHNENRPLMVNPDEEEENQRCISVLQRLNCILESYVVKVIAAILQYAGVLGLVSFFIYMLVTGSSRKGVDHVYMRPVISLPLVFLSLSIIWSNKFQEAIARPKRSQNRNATARYKSSEL